MAIALFLQQRFQSMGWMELSGVLAVQIVNWIVVLLSIGLPIAAIYRFKKQEELCGRFLVQPGHWILFCLLVILLAPASQVFAVSVFSTRPHMHVGNDGLGTHLILKLIFSALATAVALHGCGHVRRVWRIVFLAISLLLIYQIVFFACQLFIFDRHNVLLRLLVWIDVPLKGWLVVTCFAALVCDVAQRKRTDFWHVMGVVTLLLTFVAAPSIQIFRRAFVLSGPSVY